MYHVISFIQGEPKEFIWCVMNKHIYETKQQPRKKKTTSLRIVKILSILDAYSLLMKRYFWLFNSSTGSMATKIKGH